MLSLTIKSLLNRKFTSFLCILSVAFSLTLFLTIERLREDAKNSFTQTISGVDMIVGAKGGTLNLLLYTVFHMGSPVNNIRYETFEHFDKHPATRFTIPFSLGDSYRGFRVVGTNDNFFTHYEFQGGKKLEFTEGQFSNSVWGVVLGSEVAKTFSHQLGQKMVLSHGIQEGVYDHANSPFVVEGILKPTQSALDRSVYISLKGMEAMHIGWETGVPDNSKIVDPTTFDENSLEIKNITSFLLKTKSPITLLRLRRDVELYRPEPIMGVIPGLALSELWQTMAHLEKTLMVISTAVLVVGLVGIILTLMSALEARRREMAIYRSLGASGVSILLIQWYESLIILTLGALAGIAFFYLGLVVISPYLVKEFAIHLQIKLLNMKELQIIAGCLIFGSFAGLIPAIKALRQTLADGLTPKA